MLLCRQIKLPPILGYLGAGALLGPFALGAVHNADTIGLLADLGLVLLLFGIGLECGWSRIRDVGARVILIAVVEMAIMFALDVAIAGIGMITLAFVPLFLITTYLAGSPAGRGTTFARGGVK